MDIRQLRLFCRIVERRSFSLAAEDLQITQLAASQQVRTIERELKTTLLDRSSRHIAPTDAGQVLYRYAREILALHELACTEILDLRHSSRDTSWSAPRRAGRTRPARPPHVLPRPRTPASTCRCTSTTHSRSSRKWCRPEFEIGAVGAPTHRPDLTVEPLVRDEVVLVLQSGP